MKLLQTELKFYDKCGVNSKTVSASDFDTDQQPEMALSQQNWK